MKAVAFIALVATFAGVRGQYETYIWENRSTIVHLFEWKWNDIADECERFLAPKGYGGVQVSPPNENIIVPGRAWFERYQPISYKLETRSGTEEEFANMVKRCNDVGIRIFVDSVINHMAADSTTGVGTGGSPADPGAKNFPDVPFSAHDFHDTCSIQSYQDADQIRDCELAGLKDLDHSKESVRAKIVEYFNHLVDLGVAGFRVDAAKHMRPENLQIIYSRVKDLNTNFGYPSNSRPYIVQEVIDHGTEAVSKFEYTHLGAVTEFQFSTEMAQVFRGKVSLKSLANWGPDWGTVQSHEALVFVDNHDNQREGGGILTYKDGKIYRMAIAFMLSYPFGVTRVMSSYAFEDPSQPPPSEDGEKLLTPSINPDGSCGNGWICEHRWPQVYHMVEFSIAVHGTGVDNWWDNGNNQIAYSRGDRGFVAFNLEGSEDLYETLETGLPAGTYCDVISGYVDGGKCTGKTVDVDADGKACIVIEANDKNGVLAIHQNVKL